MLGTAASAQAETVLRGTEHGNATTKGRKNPTAAVDFLATKLHAQLLRVNLTWTKLEPQRGKYDQVYLDRLATTIHAATGDGMKVIVTLYGTPSWASDETLWQYAPPSYKKGVYHSFYPPAASHLVDFQAFATKLATTFGGDVLGYECRNEPNLSVLVLSAAHGVGPRVCGASLRSHADRVLQGHPGRRPEALVIAGATSPRGLNNDLWTSPQRFARELKSLVEPVGLRRLLAPSLHDRRHQEHRPRGPAP